MNLAHTVIFAIVASAATAHGDDVPALQREVVLAADSSSGKSAIAQIQAAFGDRSVESPELYDGNHSGFEHIRVADDLEVGSCFVFYLHRDKDGDRDRNWPVDKQRQRNEIKGYQGSDEGLKATHGQVVRYHWFFRIDDRMPVTRHFCHLFQLKAIGGEDDAAPLFTISGALSKGKPQLELHYQATGGQSRTETVISDWASCKGKWLECECVCKFHESGIFRISVRSLDGTVSFDREFAPLSTWREGWDFVRPKWGIYRSLEGKEALTNEEDTVSFANFSIQEWSGVPVAEAGEPGGAGQSATGAESE